MTLVSKELGWESERFLFRKRAYPAYIPGDGHGTEFAASVMLGLGQLHEQWEASLLHFVLLGFGVAVGELRCPFRSATLDRARLRLGGGGWVGFLQQHVPCSHPRLKSWICCPDL